jgi:hypothetical protein
MSYLQNHIVKNFKPRTADKAMSKQTNYPKIFIIQN